MKDKTPLVIFVVVVALAVIGGTWQSSVFAATVPPTVPTKEAVVLSTPVVDTWQETVVSGTEAASVAIPGLATVDVPAGLLKDGSKVKASALKPEDVPSQENFANISGVLYLSIEEDGAEMTEELAEPVSITFELTADQIEAFKKDPGMSVQWFDPEKEEWVRIPATLSENKLVIQTKKAGYFVFGSSN